MPRLCADFCFLHPEHIVLISERNAEQFLGLDVSLESAGTAWGRLLALSLVTAT